MKIGIMQPYVFPYIGYFQLINAVDTFVFYDDVNFIKGGWINRNTILVNKKPYMFTISLEDLSSFSLISETKINPNIFERSKAKLLKTIEQSYKKAPFFEIVFPLIGDFFSSYKKSYISELAMDSVILISNYLGLNTTFKVSSLHFNETKGLDIAERLIEISKHQGATQYINPIGGVELYDNAKFIEHNLRLNFIKSKPLQYKQFDNEFVPWLSIIDVLMFNSKDQVLSMLNEFELE